MGGSFFFPRPLLQPNLGMVVNSELFSGRQSHVFVVLFLDNIPRIVMSKFETKIPHVYTWNTFDELYSSYENVDKTET